MQLIKVAERERYKKIDDRAYSYKTYERLMPEIGYRGK